ncbi:von Hippel-Lindau tumor suppressor homolog [Ostrinia nubilalis]|uniref:von Hippel-Lindau tumor suppressor homolog n=1 Tax=Ostrinia furnacalis TaxID=93504 RepID=UPI00103E4809|nr:von Hippel-Lindau tumor suppressor homolog [Ostrinia furnacalis]
MAGNDEDIHHFYETNERGERVMVRSTASEQAIYIRFVNSVSRPVDIWWIDFQGLRRHYVRMQPRTYFNVDTYVTHPWEFTDPTTNENYVIHNKRFFRAPSCLAGVQHRTNWFVCVQVRSLRKTALLFLAQHLKCPTRVPALGLPRELSRDLEGLILAIQNTPPPPQRS